MIIPWLYLLKLGRWLIRLVMFAVILRKRHKPRVSMLWLVLTYLVPEAGGGVVPPAGGIAGWAGGARGLHRQVTGVIRAESHRVRPRRSPPPPVEPWVMPLVRQVERSTGMPVVTGNAVELLPDSRGDDPQTGFADRRVEKNRPPALLHLCPGRDGPARRRRPDPGAEKRGVRLPSPRPTPPAPAGFSATTSAASSSNTA